jgi:hypothetical protein
MVRLGPSGNKGRRDDFGQLLVTAYPQGHGMLYSVVPNAPTRTEYATSPATSEYFQKCWDRRLKNKGKLAGTCPLVGTIFPNMSFHAQQPRTLLVSHPIGPNETEMWRTYFVDKDAPEEIRQFLREYYMRYSGPAGMTEQDDMENWNYATLASKGVIARRYPYNYQMGLGQEYGVYDRPGVLTDRIAEQNQRGFYQRWAACMEA